MTKHVGINVALSALRSRRSWGIGELSDLALFVRWLASAAIDRTLLLPLGTMQEGQASPYAATSTLAIDPVYVDFDAVGDFRAAGGYDRLSKEALDALLRARHSDRLNLGMVRRAKREALAIAFEHFHETEWTRGSARAQSLADYVHRERAWLDDYALFQAIGDSRRGESWHDWPVALRDRDPAALDDNRSALVRESLAHQYGQWIAEEQWRNTRSAAHAAGVTLIGDLPFVANTESPEVWARLDEFQPGISAGVPPDAFSDTGQDWGLPTYKWDAIAAGNYAWLRTRARRMAQLYDGLRVDHVVGLYRTYGRPKDGAPFFTPADEPSQLAQGEAVLRILRESGLELVAEDLGVVPDFVRGSLAGLEIPGCKVMRWEREWTAASQPFIDPFEYPLLSAAVTGTHDTSTLAGWWDEISPEERAAFLAIPSLHTPADPESTWTPSLRDSVLRLAYAAGSRELFLPIQDIFGWRDRVNVPGTVTDINWTWCLPWPIEDLNDRQDARERAEFLRALRGESGRGQ